MIKQGRQSSEHKSNYSDGFFSNSSIQESQNRDVQENFAVELCDGREFESPNESSSQKPEKLPQIP